MLEQLSGATRVHFIVGDPIAQVKSPFGVTQAMEQRGRDAVCVPAHVAPRDLSTWMTGVSRSHNVDGIIVTVPHKFDCHAFCASASARARFLGAVNTMRRNPDGTWHGDMFDGLGYVEAMRARGCQPEGRKAMLIGAGGAGSAIAYSLVEAGVSELAIHDEDHVRRDGLIHRLQQLKRCAVRAGSQDPEGFEIAINATPVGMKAGDPAPILLDKLTPATFVGCVITSPAVPPLIQAARTIGCNTCTGADMFMKVRDLMVDFLLEV